MNRNALQIFESGIFYVLSFFLPMIWWSWFLWGPLQQGDSLLLMQPFVFLRHKWFFFLCGVILFAVILFIQRKVANTYLYYVSKTNLALFTLALYFVPLSIPMPEIMAVLIEIPFLFIAVYQLLAIGDKGKYLSNYFLAALLIGTLVVFNEAFILLTLLPLVAVFIYNRRTVRHVLLVFIGLLLPFFYAWIYYFYFKQQSFIVLFERLKPIHFTFDWQKQMPFWSILFFLLLAVLDVLNNMHTMKIRLRKTYIVLLLVVVFLVATVFLFPLLLADVYFILLPFSAIITGRYFMFLNQRRINYLLFILFVLVPLVYITFPYWLK